MANHTHQHAGGCGCGHSHEKSPQTAAKQPESASSCCGGEHAGAAHDCCGAHDHDHKHETADYSYRHAGHSPGVAAAAHQASSGSAVVDPVCGMSVDPAASQLKAEHGGKTYYFCSAGCHAKFIANPAKYLVPGQS